MAGEGDVVGGYTLVRRLGAGGMGAVWEARGDGGDGTPVALKLLHPGISSDPDARARLAREVANLNRLRGTKVSRVLDAELDADVPFIVTELVEGLTLEDSVSQEGAFDPVDLYPLATGLAEVVTQVHRVGLVHRDIKPGNVMVTYDGPVLIDFGIAQIVEDTRLTHTGFVTGTPGYLDPATLSGGELGADGDWYSFAAVLLFAATGRAPFGRERMEVVLARMTAGQPDVAGLPGQVAQAFTAALALRPADRPQPGALLRVLRRWAEGRSVAGTQPAAGTPGTAGMPATAGVPASSTLPAPSYPPPSYAPGGGVVSGAPGGASAGSASFPGVPAPTPAEQSRLVPGPLGPMASGPFGLPGQRVPEPWELPPPTRSWLVLAVGALLVAGSVVLPGVAVVVSVVGFVLLTTAGLMERRTRRRRLAAGRRSSDPWVATAWSVPLLALGLLTSLVPLLIGTVAAACVWWIGSNLVLTDFLGTVPAPAGAFVTPVALACGLVAAWWVPLAEVTRLGARACWALLAPTRGSTRVWGLALGGVGVVLVLYALGSGAFDGAASETGVSWWPLPAPPDVWG
ncbi:serine/threonine protein kinase [Salana multivorans]|uniref:Serine/threonine protein kinase n=1 Tax=Salana multivorans TaxID=120377 RepID=A0A3N2D8J7_9MICO|nr:serine/threonine-protein kinase [Salana multivorans]ROR96111.1 serine/threonine protein kinase [Salana multivorans]